MQKFVTKTAPWSILEEKEIPERKYNSVFNTTRWTLISQIKNLQDESSSKLRDELYRDYWQPIYCYIYNKCHNIELTYDLTQEFFAKCIIENNLFAKAEKCRGKFRGLLITTLKHFLVSENRQKNSTIKQPEKGIVSIDSLDHVQLAAAVPANMNEEDSFNYSWIHSILSNVSKRLEIYYQERNNYHYWQAFQLRVLDPIQKNTPPATMSEIVTQTVITNETQASNIIASVKRKFRVELRNHIREYVNSENEVNEELSDFSNFLKNFLQD